MKKILFIAAVFFISGAALFACDMSFTLTDGSGESVSIYPDKSINLEKAEKYTLTVTFKENHARCRIPAEDTVFLLDDEKWIFGKGELPFIITENFTWDSVSKREYEAVIPFEVNGSGEVYLEVIRECDRKEGYDEYLVFKVI